MIDRRKRFTADLVTFLYELESLLRKRTGYILSAAYLIIVTAVCTLQGFRDGYFSWAVQLPVSLIALVLPSMAMLLISASLSPVFSSEAERAASEIPACCLMGRRRQSAIKLLAGITFAAIMDTALLAATVGITSVTGHLRPGEAVMGLDYYGMTYWMISPVWTVGQHLWLSVLSQAIGAAILAVITLFVSKHSHTPAAAMAVTVVILLAEFFFRHFGPFPIILTEINVWSLFESYMLFDMDLFHGTPMENLTLLTGLWLAIGSILAGLTIRPKHM